MLSNPPLSPFAKGGYTNPLTAMIYRLMGNDKLAKEGISKIISHQKYYQKIN